jgi:hypothetical protein
MPQTIWNFISGLASNVTLSVALMIFGYFLTKDNKKDNHNHTRILWWIGFFSLSVGLPLTIFATILQIATSNSSLLTELRDRVWIIIYPLLTLNTFYLLGILVAIYLVFYFLRNLCVEKRYKIQVAATIPPSRREPYYSDYEANILVENIGQGKIICRAKIVKVTFIKGDITEDVSITKLNPKGNYLSWYRNRDEFIEIILQEDMPTIIRLIDGHFESSGTDNITIHASGGRTFPYLGSYLIQVDILRKKEKRFVKFYTFEKILKIDGRDGLMWVD